MSGIRLDQALVNQQLAASRSKAEQAIGDGKVKVNGRLVTKPSFSVSGTDSIEVADINPYVSRAALKIVSANKKFKIPFQDKTVLDVGSSTGGFSEYALLNGAAKVIAVDVGTNQMHPRISSDARVSLYEKTDIRDVGPRGSSSSVQIDPPDIIVCDVSFISLKLIIPHLLGLANDGTVMLLMCKPQFEAGKNQVSKGVIKNESIRRRILRDFEQWLKDIAVIIDKADSDTPGEKGNIERFFLIKKYK